MEFVLFYYDDMGLNFWMGDGIFSGRLDKAKKYSTWQTAQNWSERMPKRNLRYATVDEVKHFWKTGHWEAV